MHEDDSLDWNVRRIAMRALRRVVLRESVLLRLLPEKAAVGTIPCYWSLSAN